MNRAVCVDASFIVAMLTPERYTTPATARWKAWIKDDFRILAPSLLGYEVTSALYRKVLQEQIEPKDGQAALEQFLAMDIESIHPPELHARPAILPSSSTAPILTTLTISQWPNIYLVRCGQRTKGCTIR